MKRSNSDRPAVESSKILAGHLFKEADDGSPSGRDAKRVKLNPMAIKVGLGKGGGGEAVCGPA